LVRQPLAGEVRPSARRRPGEHRTNRKCPDNGRVGNSEVIVARHSSLAGMCEIAPLTIRGVGLSRSDASPPTLGGGCRLSGEQRCR
jgi:hypothetical protein